MRDSASWSGCGAGNGDARGPVADLACRQTRGIAPHIGGKRCIVGGKVGINLEGAKNMVGAFWQPNGVVCDLDALETLPPREMRCGLGEMAKYHFLTGDDLLAMDEVERVARCVEIKADVVAGDEREIAVLDAVLAPFEVVRNLGRLIVFVNAEKADVEVVARKREIIGIAAVKRNLLFRSKDQTDVGVAFETIEVVLAALVERDHVAAQAGLVERFLFDLGHHCAARGERLGADMGDVAERFLAAVGGAADALPEPGQRVDDERRAGEAHDGEPGVVIEEQRRESDEGQRLAGQVAEGLGDGLLHLPDVVGDA